MGFPYVSVLSYLLSRDTVLVLRTIKIPKLFEYSSTSWFKSYTFELVLKKKTCFSGIEPISFTRGNLYSFNWSSTNNYKNIFIFTSFETFILEKSKVTFNLTSFSLEGKRMQRIKVPFFRYSIVLLPFETETIHRNFIPPTFQRSMLLSLPLRCGLASGTWKSPLGGAARQGRLLTKKFLSWAQNITSSGVGEGVKWNSYLHSHEIDPE